SYAAAAVTATNGAPTITAPSPTSEVVELDVGDTETFSVSATDPDGDALTTTWTVNGAAAGNGATFAYTPTAADVGIRVIRALVSDGSPDGVAEREWGVRVLADDGDVDGWNANVDCDDDDPNVYPTHREVVGNAVDDDCDSATLDSGSAPVAKFSQSVGAGLVVTFADASTDANDDISGWSWSFGDGSTPSVEQNPVHTYTAKGTYTLTLTVTDSTGNTDTVTRDIVVASAPTASFTYLPPSPVGGSEVDFTDTSSDADGTIASWAWTFGDTGTSSEQHPKHTYLGPGTFDVTLTVTDDDGSTGSATQTIVIGIADPGTAPVALFRPNVLGKNLASAPSGATVVAYSSFCCGGHEPWVMLDDVVGLPWAANKGTPNHFASIQLIGTSTGPRLIDTIQVQRRHDGCCPTQGIITFAVDVSTTGFAAADFTQVLAGTMVENTLLQTFQLSVPTFAKYVRYRPLTSPDGSWLSTGTFKVLSSSTGPRTVTFQNQSTNAVSYKWTFGDGGTSTDAAPTHTYAVVGTYTVTLVAKAADGRTSTTTRQYEVRGPTTDFTVEPSSPEPGQPAVFTDATLYASAPGATYAWSFGDGGTSNSAGTLHTFATAGTYTVTYTVTDTEGTTDTATRDVTVAAPAPTALPRARFAPSSGGVNVAFSGAGASIHSFSSQYSASYPATTILDEDPNNTYWATGNTIRNGWVKIDLAGDLQDVDRIRIGGDGGTERVKDFKVSVSATTADDAAFTEVLSASNPNDDTLREYVLPGGAVSARYVRVELLNNWGHPCCAAIDRFDVLTGPTTAVGRNLALSANGATIAAFSGQYDATSYPVTSMIDGDPGNNPWLTTNGVTAGFAKVTLSSAAPRMIDRIRMQPRWGAQRVKDFEVALSSTGTADTDFVTVLTATAADNENLQTFLLPYPMAAKHVLYRVKTNRANGNFTGTGDLRVDTGQESSSLTVRFRNLSRNATSYAWSFGDGSTSTAASPAHTYASPGTYDVTLTATNANGSTTFALQQVVRAPEISYTPAAPQAQQQIDFLDASPAELDIQSWSWSFGDGSTSTFQNPVKTYAAAGTYTVTMTGTDREGNALVATESVVVTVPSFRAQFHPRGTFNMASLENGASVIAFSSQYDTSTWSAPKLLDAFTNTAWHSSASPAQSSKWIKFSLAGGRTYQLDRFQLLGRQDCCYDQHPRDFELAVSTTGTADADFKTVLRATLPANQTALQTFTLPRPVLAKYVLYRTLTTRGSNVVATAMLRALSGQVNTSTVTFDDLTVGGTAPFTYAWDFGDGGTSSEASPTHTFPGPGTYSVTATVTDSTGATSSYTLEQKILNAPAPAFANSPVVPNEVQSTTFTDQTPSPADGPIVERRWNWGDGTPNTALTAGATTHTFADNGVYNVTLEVLDAWGQTASVTRAVTVANVAPTVNAGVDWRWREDRALTATTTVADVAGSRDPVTCTWTYGDGSAPGTGCPFNHTYANTGTFTATVTANDGDGGVATDAFTVEVIEQEVTGGGGGGGSGSAGGTGAGKSSKDYVYTADGDFELGTLLNVNHDAPGSDQLQLNKQAKPFPFVYIANSGRGTAVRIDVDTGVILGEYMTAPVNRSRNPSRTTVDKLGNVWVTNRDEGETRTIDGLNVPWGSTTRIGLIVGGARSNADGTPNPVGEYLKAPFEYNTCVDRNADGLIRTSRGLTNILPWPNTSGVDHDGGVETAVDECIQFYVRVRGTNTRTVAITADNDAYIGGANNWHERVDGETGQRVPGTAFNLNCGGYGGLIDGNGILWSARYGGGLLRYNTNTKTGVCLGNSHGDYGLGVDPVTGHIWQTTLNGNRVVKLNPAATTASTIEIARYFHGNNDAQGVAVDGKANVWVSHALYGAPTIGRVRTDGTYLGNPSLGPGASGSTGVAVDANGKVWSANYGTSNASRIDPEIGQKIAGATPSGWYDMVVSLGAGASPYNYSDMTGAVAIGAASPSGFWSIQQDATALGTVWKRISWDGSTPAGTSLTVEARAADTQAALTSTPFVTATDGVLLSGVVGRFIEVRATLQTNDPTTTPILTDIRISANTPPVATPGSAVTNKDEPKAITLAATDDDGDTLTYEVVDQPAHGSVVIVDNVATYTPAAGYTGADSFTFKARDASGESNVATVTLNVLATNLPPVAPDLDVSTLEDVALAIVLPATDPDGDTLTLSYTKPLHGTYDGTTYTPEANYFGPDSFTYTATDPDGESDDGLVSITVSPVNDSPTAANDAYAIDEDTTLSIPAPGLLANDSDVDGDALSTVAVAGPTHGTLTYDGGGAFTYVPALNFFGSDSFSYRSSDGLLSSKLAVVSITVRPVNDAPAVTDRAVETDEDTPVTIDLSGTDDDGDTLTISTTAPAHGRFIGDVYTPDSNYNGPDSFTYTATDAGGLSDTATVTITVRPVNDAPEAADRTVATDEDTPL
ncbi:MAG: PKD domain-containing protein, partial [Actinomycetota bacterium]|nr:PKD domain-containing protein [Actinomycetota bacterium]